MYLLNTTFVVLDPLLDEFLQWAREVYLRAIDDSDSLHSPLMSRVLTVVEPGTTSVAIQARARSLAEAEAWQEQSARLLADDLRARFAGQVLHFTTFMEVLK